MKIITTTESLCPECLKKIPAHYLVENNNVYLSKTCPEHGPYRTLVWRDAALYEQWQRESIHAPKWKNGAPSSRGCPWDCGLCSEHEGGTCTLFWKLPIAATCAVGLFCGQRKETLNRTGQKSGKCIPPCSSKTAPVRSSLAGRAHRGRSARFGADRERAGF